MKNRTLLIVIGVILLCCCVVAIAAAVAYPTIKNYLNSATSGFQSPNPDATSQSSSAPAGGGLGDPTLKGDVWNSILTAESGRGCDDVISTAIDLAQRPDSNGVWVEDWSANVCGNDAVFEVTFTPDPKGGTNYDIKEK